MAADRDEVLNSDSDAFRAFVEFAAPTVVGYLKFRVGGDHALAEDLAQETFLSAHRELRRGIAVARPLPWILGIARHKWLDHCRASQRSVPIEFPILDDAVGDLGEDDSRIASLWQRDAVVRSLSRLPIDQRVALVLRYADGYRVGEICCLMERSEGAVESLLVRGRVGFRRLMEEDGLD